MGVQLTRKQKLKVYRTPIGFHDAYVAAPSQKAALVAWGSDHDLFARGIAELVGDPELTREPLAKPGEVVRRSRGTAAEQIAALPADRPKRAREVAEPSPPPPAPKPKPKPKPDRAPLDAARAALDETAARHRRERDALAEREAALARERRDTEKRQAAEVATLRAEAEQAQAAYDAAMRKWRG
ncbi:hypothetical protein AWL63_09890 [Sphingomonas panacis]|uniref:Cell envelope biogenesis protein TolA n=1 Tax=Sphingomonas panacis TaxID=1560345 RepID=A0A1B3Z9X3_9SPHN|nr:hypothetical protein [Sphingomonas panacis]AOH84238.1 hypothetical protein AWL63_09890 [Sphingomonas panacis]